MQHARASALQHTAYAVRWNAEVWTASAGFGESEAIWKRAGVYGRVHFFTRYLVANYVTDIRIDYYCVA